VYTPEYGEALNGADAKSGSRSAIVALALFAGFAYPLEFLLHLDGYLLHLSGTEVLQLYAWGFIVESVVVGVAMSVAFVMSRMVCAVTPWNRSQLPNWSLVLVGVALVSGVLTNAGFTWVKIQAWWSGYSNIDLQIQVATFAAVTLLICSIATRPGPRTRILAIARALGAASVIVALSGTAFMALSRPDTADKSTDIPDRSQAPIILISVDALSALHLSSYGYNRPTSPEIDRFVESATLYRHFYSVSNWTSPGTAALILGRRPWESEVQLHHARAPRRLAKQGLPATLRRKGYSTFVVVTNNYASPYIHHTELDWDVASYDDRWSWGPRCYWQTFEENFLLLKAFRKVVTRSLVAMNLLGPAEHFSPDRAFGLAKRMLAERKRDSPFFLWIHLLPPHDPYAAPAPHVGLFNASPKSRTMFDSFAAYQSLSGEQLVQQSLLRDRYDESVHYVDASMGRFLAWLRSQALFDPSLIVLTADHGESFSHQYGGHGGPALHEELIHIPLVIKRPQQTRGGQSFEVMDQSELPSLIQKALGMEVNRIPPSESGAAWPVQAWSMNFESMTGPDRLDRERSVAAISLPWKFVAYLDRPRSGQGLVREKLFNLDIDPDESVDRLRYEPDVAKALRDQVLSELKQHRGAP
jgi:arylsulfatase A-like enzyme